MSRRRRLASFTLLTVAVAAIASFAGCTSILGDFELGQDGVPEGGVEGGGPGASGAACQAASECASGFCVDGVCCDTACDGTCESCALGAKGTCSPIPDGTDPEKECLPTPVPDAGAPVDPVDAGDAGDAGGTELNVPDGGLTSDDAVCAGSCNGNRQCKFPSAETTCGTKFCNTASEAARYACDGEGHCELGLSTCESYACEGDACRVNCASQDDCTTATHFCNPQGVCQQKLADGVACTLPTDCASGFCVGSGAKVCCNSDCDQTPGGTCVKPGAIGKCQCNVDCGAGSCRLFYRDADSDGHGDKFATVLNGDAKVGCDNAAPPSGFVTSNDDCADGDPRAYPGQTDWFTTAITGTSSFDFNCDGTTTKEKPEYPGASCSLCQKDENSDKCFVSRTKCQSTKQLGYLSCAPAAGLCGLKKCTVCGGPTRNPYVDGFTQKVDCGDTAKYTLCGKCEVVGSGIKGTTTSTAYQRCH